MKPDERGSYSPLDYLRNCLGVSSLVELAGRPFGPDQWRCVGDAYTKALDLLTVPPPKGDGELRPVFMSSSVSTLDEAEAAARASLLCHSVAIILPDSSNYPERFLRLLARVESLIDEGLIILLSEDALHKQRRFGQEFSPEKSYFDAAFSTVGSLLPDSQEETWAKLMAGLEIAAAMDACSEFPDRLDLTPTSKEQVEVIRYLLEQRGRGMYDGRLASDRIRFIPSLFSLRMPSVALATADLLSLRRDGLFEGWRVALQEGLKSAGQLNEDELTDPNNVRIREIRDVLTDAANDATVEARRSKHVRSGIVGVTSFGVGCATGALGAIGGVEVAALAGGAGAATALVIDWLGGRPTGGQREFRRVVAHIFPES